MHTKYGTPTLGAGAKPETGTWCTAAPPDRALCTLLEMFKTPVPKAAAASPAAGVNHSELANAAGVLRLFSKDGSTVTLVVGK